MTTTSRTSRPGRAPLLLALVAALALAGAGAPAQEHEDDPEPAAHESAPEGTHEAHGADSEHGETPEAFAGHHVHAHHKNGLALGLAGTWESEENRVFSTIAIEYERMLSDRWGFQAIVEHVNDFDAWVAVAPVGFRLGGTLWAVAGPGLETEARRTGLEPEPHEESHATTHEDERSEAHEEGGGPFFLWRFGLVYSIHLGESGRWALGTSLSLDLVREHGQWAEAWVFGAGIVYHF